MSAPPPIQSYATPWGASLTATFIAAIIYGITVVQTFFYFRHYPTDRASWKAIVAVLFVLDTSALALFMYSMQYYLVLSWGIPEMTAVDVKTFPAEYVISAVLTFIVQLCYINTVRFLRPPVILPLLLLALALTALGTALILPALQLQLALIPVIVPNHLNHLAFNIARATALACDLGIVAALCALLRRRRTVVRSWQRMINTLIVLALQRGVLQAVVQAGELLAYAIKPDAVYFLPFHVIVSRIYCTSLLATLNTRAYAAARVRPGPGSTGTPPPSYLARDPSAAHPSAGGSRASSSALARAGHVLTTLFEPPFLDGAECGVGGGVDDVEAGQGAGLGASLGASLEAGGGGSGAARLDVIVEERKDAEAVQEAEDAEAARKERTGGRGAV